ncbi:15-cis-phytoene desaturase [Enhygromyxa salina]|uniref:15-cis-phytoene desaturase n=1 Tax=Enhygromyxa salina TaxID=215803 RepID=A0A2S9YH31_9BACT|nr:FAD-dependent oxidoreductase [Enhygromyxa salina]PRQ04418.1 15-cis-phytoene desaturase [Enhygromyxa salina]
MRLELLAFDVLVLGPPLIASLGRSTFFLDRWRRAWPSVGLAALPALAWLAWLSSSAAIEFSPAHSLSGSFAPLGLPPGALLLVPAIGFACLFCWWVGMARADDPAPKPAHYSLHGALLAALALGVTGLIGDGPRWASLSLIAVGSLSLIDLGLGTKLVPRPRFWAFLALVGVLAIVFGGALIQRGVVEHAPASILGLRLIGAPIEDLGFAVALAGASVLVFERMEQRAAADPRASKGLIARFIERRFGGYRHLVAPVDESLPRELAAPRTVAVVGAGLAGLGAAAKLAERGFSVTVFEREAYLGGKLGAWKTTTADGRELEMDHGFHAFFRHYYNLNAFLAELGVERNLSDIGDYLILTNDGRTYSFKEVATTPILNLLSLARHGIYNLREVAGRHTGPKMEALLRYDPEQTFADFDEVSYAQFAEDARLPDSLKLVFNTFARAFFSDGARMSMAELIKGFHFYYLSNDNGLIYDYLNDDFEAALLSPLRERLESHGVDLRLGAAVTELVRDDDGRFEVEGEGFDYLVVASDVVGTRALFETSPSLVAAAPETAAKVRTLAPGQRYCVVRLWLDRDIDRELPGFVISERVRLLDAMAFVHRTTRAAASWVAEREAAGQRGAVIELHCYAVPEELPDDEAALRELLITELHHFFPELTGSTVIHQYTYIRRDFPAFHVGMHATRPSWDTELDNLFLAGDWVVLPFPTMLMEAAYSSGLLAANAIFRKESLREEPMWTVPRRGFMAGWAKRPF